MPVVRIAIIVVDDPVRSVMEQPGARVGPETMNTEFDVCVTIV
jgi:hypothetical protein